MNFIRPWVKAVTAHALHHTGLRPLLASARRWKVGGVRVMVVSYHRVVDDFEREVRRSIPGTLISQTTLRRQLEQAAACGYDFATLGTALEVLSGQRESKRDLFVVTFDDAYADAFEYGAPVLRQLGVPAIMYVPVGLVGTQRRFEHDRLFHLLTLLSGQPSKYVETRWHSALDKVSRKQATLPALLDDFLARNSQQALLEAISELEHLLKDVGPRLPSTGRVMNWSEIREWVRLGFDVGAHTVNHVVLPLVSAERQQDEIIQSKVELERNTGTSVKDFAYCNGWYSPKVIQLLVRAGFRSAVTTEDLPNVRSQDPYRIRRKVLWENFSNLGGTFSTAVTACHLDDTFSMLGATKPVLGEMHE